MTKSSLIFVVGPTATGKTQFAISGCREIGGEIINCDSIQFYQGLVIGAAKPTALELEGVPYHLLDRVGLGESYNAGEFRRDAHEIIRGGEMLGTRQFFIVGGSGFYFQALEKGMYEAASISPEARDEVGALLTSEGLAGLFRELHKLDPETAIKIGPNDSYRLQRYLQLVKTHRKSISEIRRDFSQTESPDAWKGGIVKIGLHLPRPILRDRISERAEKMLKSGLIEEVKELLARGYGNWPPIRSVGYKEVVMHLQGLLSRSELHQAIVISTMQLAKRQMTWFKRDPAIRWFNVEKGGEEALNFLRATFQS